MTCDPINTSDLISFGIRWIFISRIFNVNRKILCSVKIWCLYIWGIRAPMYIWAPILFPYEENPTNAILCLVCNAIYYPHKSKLMNRGQESTWWRQLCFHNIKIQQSDFNGTKFIVNTTRLLVIRVCKMCSMNASCKLRILIRNDKRTQLFQINISSAKLSLQWFIISFAQFLKD